MDSRKIPTDASLKWKVLTLQPIPKKATVKLFDGEPNQTPAHPDQKRSTSCDQNVVGSAELDLLKGELLEIAALAQRTQQLLQKSHDQMVERARVTRPFLALNVMFQACAANAANAADRDAAERGKRLTERIYKTIRTKMSEKPMSELSGASLDPRLDSILVKEGVLVADIAAAIKANCHKLREKILRPRALRARSTLSLLPRSVRGTPRPHVSRLTCVSLSRPSRGRSRSSGTSRAPRARPMSSGR
jgi:hypothetical protein